MDVHGYTTDRDQGSEACEETGREMKYLLIVLLLTSCGDQYRYYCQNPDNFSKAQCQRPRCEFDQTCPDYLVAPVLEKKIEGTLVSPPIQQNGSASVNCR